MKAPMWIDIAMAAARQAGADEEGAQYAYATGVLAGLLEEIEPHLTPSGRAVLAAFGITLEHTRQ
jgi:hypothetical protein